MRLSGLILTGLVFFLGSTWSAVAADCTAGKGIAMKPEGAVSAVAVRIATNPATISVGRRFRVMVSICEAEDAVVDQFVIDATMPKHRHGMNYVPKVTHDGARTYTASGLFFHMPGLWRVQVTFHTDKERQRFTHDVVVE